MATEENHPSFYSALSNAIADHELVGDLLQHHEFRLKAGHICLEIAGPEGGEDLLQEACLRALEHASELNSDTIPSEGAFFRWFSRLARLTHLSNTLSAAAANECTEGAGRWPDSSDDVPPDGTGRFLAHADACPYHTRILRTEEEALRAAFNRARGLDSHGRILLGDELDASVAEHRRRLQSWREATSRKGAPIGRLALFNGGREVASCGEFYEFSVHKSLHELDPYSGLQIFVSSSDDPNKNVLLGFYALAGVRHTGREHGLELDNGYTVGLKVKARAETTFDIDFRCVETKKIKAELDADERGVGVVTKEPPDGESFGGSPVVPDHALPHLPDLPVTPEPGGWWPLARIVQATALIALLLALVLPSFLAGKWLGEMDMVEKSLAEWLSAHVDTGGTRDALSDAPPPEGRVVSAQVKAEQPKAPPSAQRTVKNRTTQKPRATASVPPRAPRPRSSTVGPTRQTARVARTQPKAPTAGVRRPPPADGETHRFMVSTLRGSGHTVRDVKSINRVDDRRPVTWLVSYDEQGGPLLHVTKDDRVSERLYNALQGQRLRVVRVAKQEPARAKIKIFWEANVSAPSGAKPFVVTLNAHIFGESENIFVPWLSYKGEGSSLKAAYDNAVRGAVTQVIERIRRDGEQSLIAVADEANRAKLPQPTRPEAGPADDDDEN